MTNENQKEIEAALKINADQIQTAYNLIQPYIVRTPIIESPRINEFLDRRLLIKAECLQYTGSFKLRGASNAVWGLDHKTDHVVAFSSGNHAQGVARAAATRGVKATIVMPEDTPKTKLEGTKAYGADVVTYDRYSQSREAIGDQLSKKFNANLIKPYDDIRVITGQGTIGLELMEQLSEIDAIPETILCCCGGGGLIAGLSIAVHSKFPGVKIWPAEPKFYDDTKRSLAKGRIVRAETKKLSICDAIVTPQPGNLTFAINQRHLTGGAVIDDETTLKTIATVFKHLKIVVEPGGAVAIAAALTGQYPPNTKTLLAIASGGNIDRELFKKALDIGPFF